MNPFSPGAVRLRNQGRSIRELEVKFVELEEEVIELRERVRNLEGKKNG